MNKIDILVTAWRSLNTAVVPLLKQLEKTLDSDKFNLVVVNSHSDIPNIDCNYQDNPDDVSFIMNHPNVKKFIQLDQNLGHSYAINKGLPLIETEYCIIGHGDWFPRTDPHNWTDILIENFKDEKCGFVTPNGVMVSSHPEELLSRPLTMEKRILHLPNYIGEVFLMTRSKFIKQFKYPSRYFVNMGTAIWVIKVMSQGYYAVIDFRCLIGHNEGRSTNHWHQTKEIKDRYIEWEQKEAGVGPVVLATSHVANMQTVSRVLAGEFD